MLHLYQLFPINIQTSSLLSQFKKQVQQHKLPMVLQPTSALTLHSLPCSLLQLCPLLAPIYSAHSNLAVVLTPSLKLFLLRTVNDFLFAPYNGLNRLHLTWLFIMTSYQWPTLTLEVVTDFNLHISPFSWHRVVLVFFLPHGLLHHSLAASSVFVNPLKCQHFSESHPQYSRLKLLQTPVTMCMLWLSNIVQAWMALLSSRPTYLISMVIFRWTPAASSNSGCSKLNSSLIIQTYFSI